MHLISILHAYLKDMFVIFILIGLSLFVAVIFLIIFIWNVKSGQYDDDYTPSVRMLFDDNNETEEEPNKEKDL